MSYTKEFETVDLLLNSDAETKGVDAFALSLIKAERQLRKLFTHLIFQYPCFSSTDVKSLRGALSGNNKVYSEGFENGFNALYLKTIEDLVGTDYSRLHTSLQKASSYRNKIFHGQLTSTSLSQSDLLAVVSDIRTWCEKLASGATAEIAYDGFERNSFRKSSLTDLSTRFKLQISNINDYAQFITNEMARQR